MIKNIRWNSRDKISQTFEIQFEATQLFLKDVCKFLIIEIEYHKDFLVVMLVRTLRTL